VNKEAELGLKFSYLNQLQAITKSLGLGKEYKQDLCKEGVDPQIAINEAYKDIANAFSIEI